MKEALRENRGLGEPFQLSLLKLVTKHYNQHPLLDVNISIETFRETAVEEIQGFCLPPGCRELYEYLMCHWYSMNEFQLWGKNCDLNSIALTKTKMAVKAHWSALKRHDLLHYNRPRCDLLLYLIAEKVFPRFEKQLESLITGNPVGGPALRQDGKRHRRWKYGECTIQIVSCGDAPVNRS